MIEANRLSQSQALLGRDFDGMLGCVDKKNLASNADEISITSIPIYLLFSQSVFENIEKHFRYYSCCNRCARKYQIRCSNL